MKIKPFVFVSFFLMAVSFSMAQSTNYQPVLSDGAALFKEANTNLIIGLRIDSVKIGDRIVLFPFTTIQEVADYCFSPNKASWIGEKIIVAANGINLFFNRHGDTISINTQAKLNETWIAYNKTDSLRIEARVQSIETANVLGLSDSIKKIAFRAIDENGNTLASSVNNKGLTISKKYGFLETLNFFLFPNLASSVTNNYLSSYTLVGLSNPKLGIQNLTWLEVHNFKVGDELHVREHNTGDAYNFDDLREYDNRCIYKYIERNDYPDSVVYKCARQQSIKVVYIDSTTYENRHDTIKEVITSNPVFDKLPGEPQMKETLYSLYMLNDDYREKVEPNINDHLYEESDGNCFWKLEGEGCFYEKHYIEGLGGPYFYCSGYLSETKERKLVYYKKDAVEWGDKLVLTSAKKIENNEKLQVSYCFTSKVLTFKLSEEGGKNRVNIFNQAGQLLINEQFKGAELELNLSGFRSGIYLYHFVSSSGGGQTGKVVVK